MLNRRGIKEGKGNLNGITYVIPLSFVSQSFVPKAGLYTTNKAFSLIWLISPACREHIKQKKVDCHVECMINIETVGINAIKTM